MSFKYSIAETDAFVRSIKRSDQKIVEKIRTVIYPQLSENPFFGNNIKKLKGELQGLYRYRVGGHRLFYKIDQGRVIVFMLELKLRKDSYK